jgi:hypothetical protein
MVGFDEGPLSRKPPLKLYESAAIGDPTPSPAAQIKAFVPCQGQTLRTHFSEEKSRSKWKL